MSMITEMAQAHIHNVNARIVELEKQKQAIDVEVQRLKAYVIEGQKAIMEATALASEVNHADREA